MRTTIALVARVTRGRAAERPKHTLMFRRLFPYLVTKSITLVFGPRVINGWVATGL